MTRAPTATAVTTYAVYMHGLNQGVRDVFAAKGMQPENIIGTAVAQGDPIMFADSTGNSLCNHVHIQVMSGTATRLAGAALEPRQHDPVRVQGRRPAGLARMAEVGERVVKPAYKITLGSASPQSVVALSVGARAERRPGACDAAVGRE